MNDEGKFRRAVSRAVEKNGGYFTAEDVDFFLAGKWRMTKIEQWIRRFSDKLSENHGVGKYSIVGKL